MLGQISSQGQDRLRRRTPPGLRDHRTIADIEVIVLGLEVRIHELTELYGPTRVGCEIIRAVDAVATGVFEDLLCPLFAVLELFPVLGSEYLEHLAAIGELATQGIL